MDFLTLEYYEHMKHFVHPHINDNIYHYRKGNEIELPPYHGCNHINRNGTRKYIDYGRGYQCICPTQKHYRRETKDEYNLRGVYWTRYMTQYGIRHLFKNKGNLVFNHKLRKYVHISKTPMKYYFHYTETVKNRALTNE